VAEAMTKLEGAGLIRYSSDRITVLDTAGLAKRSCECRDLIMKEYARLLGGEAPTRDETGG
jgi:hypothetical protein